MSIDQYFLYVVVASLTIASPGPGVILSIANSIKYGVAASIPGIIGIASGMFSIAVIASSGVGTIIMASPNAFLILKYIGAAYLIYLGVKLWKAKEMGIKSELSSNGNNSLTARRRFRQGLLITLSNPKPMVFFIALFPQFINTSQGYVQQFGLLSFTFCALICVIHFAYAYFAGSIGKWISKNRGYQVINRTSSLCFFGFAIGVALNR